MAKRSTNSFGDSWRIWAAFVYLSICVFDYGVMPWLIEQSNKRLTAMQSVELSVRFPESSQATVLAQLQTPRVWSPLTAFGGGMFHISFGAILGATAFNKYREDKEENISDQAPVDESDGKEEKAVG